MKNIRIFIYLFMYFSSANKPIRVYSFKVIVVVTSNHVKGLTSNVNNFEGIELLSTFIKKIGKIL